MSKVEFFLAVLRVFADVETGDISTYMVQYPYPLTEQACQDAAFKTEKNLTDKYLGKLIEVEGKTFELVGYTIECAPRD